MAVLRPYKWQSQLQSLMASVKYPDWVCCQFRY